MINQGKFERYAAATELARLASGGSGELNNFDHIARDLHEPGFDEKLEKVEQWRLNAWRSELEPELKKKLHEEYSGKTYPAGEM